MVLQGRIENGSVVLTESVALPDGAPVTVIVPAFVPSHDRAERRVHLPLVPSQAPGSRRLTGDDVAAILSQDDVSS
jgi:hypothetical protein